MISNVLRAIGFLTFSALFSVTLASLARADATRLLNADSYAQVRSHYAHQPLIVHIWGLTCGPCLEELSRWGELKQKHPEMNLVLIQAEDAPLEAVETALTNAHLNLVESWSARSELDEFTRSGIDASWNGEMPRTLLISADGSVATVRGVADSDGVTKWLASSATAGGQHARISSQK